MGLGGQYGDRGYAMAALLVALGVMSVLMMAVLPAWPFQAKREKELELIFRGEQYARAVGLYQLKNRSFPPSIDALVQGRYLRKKYKDPMTKDGEFQSLFAGANPGPGVPGGPAASTEQPPTQPPPGAGRGAGAPGFQTGPGGLIGVVSKSKEDSIRVYRGRTKYNEWQFVFANNRGAPGGGNPGGPNVPGSPGGRGRGRGSPGFGGPGFPPTGPGGAAPGGRGVPGPGRGVGLPGGGVGPGGPVRPPGQ